MNEEIEWETKHDFLHKCADTVMIPMTEAEYREKIGEIRQEAIRKFNLIF
jgi:hypothetical protein